MVDTIKFKQFLDVADQLGAAASKEEIVECARLLAINVAHYESVYGALPLDETLAIAYSDNPNQAQIDLMSSGMETFVGVLGAIVQGFEPKPTH